MNMELARYSPSSSKRRESLVAISSCAGIRNDESTRWRIKQLSDKLCVSASLLHAFSCFCDNLIAIFGIVPYLTTSALSYGITFFTHCKTNWRTEKHFSPALYQPIPSPAHSAQIVYAPADYSPPIHAHFDYALKRSADVRGVGGSIPPLH